ncbi:MAG: SDR family oxidoreductase [Betaproteobacteria bacterium]|nr:SDR family oxidoreductase [Betaproteobacteria bacterium]
MAAPDLVLAGRVAIISGASEGLGLAIAEAYLRAGASVVLFARRAARVDEAARQLARCADGAAARVLALSADVASADDTKRVVAAALERFGKIDILVNNAGVHGAKGSLDAVAWEDWASAVSVNLLGSALLVRAALPHLKSRRYGKIIQLSGGGATKPMPGMSAYAASKAAVVRLAETLAVELAPWHIDVNCIAPGALNTRLLDDVLEAGAQAVGQAAHEAAQRQKDRGGVPLEVPAKLAVFLASPRSDGITGKLIAAVWDDWESFPEHLRELRESDVYTLRRIVARDRGFAWGDK